jgi:serine/threonine protein kinase
MNLMTLLIGLDACHRAGIAHRDLKPENILLDSNYVLKIADFGLARHFDNGHQLMYSSVGTPLYLPPEMRTGRGTYEGPLMDMWAAGMLLFIMISGVPPWGEYGDWYYNAWTGGKQADFWRWHEQYGHPFTAPARELLTAMMQVDPARRATIDVIKKHAWFTGSIIDDVARTTERRLNIMND